MLGFRLATVALAGLLAALPARAQTPGQPSTILKSSPQVGAQPRVTAPARPNLPGADVETAIQLAMLEASKGAQEDLKAIMAQVEGANAVKPAQPAPNSKTDAGPCSGDTVAAWRICLQRIDAKLASLPPDLERTGLMKELRRQLDSMSEMGELNQLKLQAYMDRRTRAFQTMSNLSKKLSETSNSIVANMK